MRGTFSVPIDILEFFIMTPLPGSADHKQLYEQGVWMDPDMNSYDTEHVVAKHPKMTAEQWLDIYRRAWHLYYSPEHCETLMRRGAAGGPGAKKIQAAIMLYYGTYRFEHLHPLQCGILRRKVRTTRRPAFPRENPLLFYPRRLFETVSTWASLGIYFLELERIRRRIARDPAAKQYTDLALTPVITTVTEPKPAATCEPCETEKSPAVVPLTMLTQSAAANRNRAA
jgi:hypothetical protein